MDYNYLNDSSQESPNDIYDKKGRESDENSNNSNCNNSIHNNNNNNNANNASSSNNNNNNNADYCFDKYSDAGSLDIFGADVGGSCKPKNHV